MFVNDADFYRTISLIVPGIAGGNAQTAFTFPDIGDLRYARTVAIEMICSEDQAVAFPAQAKNMALSQINLVSFVFNTNDPEREDQGDDGRFTSTIDSIRYIPAPSLHRISNSGNPFVFAIPRWRNTWIVWEKSQALIAPGGLANTEDLAITLGIYYTFFNLKGKPVKRT